MPNLWISLLLLIAGHKNSTILDNTKFPTIVSNPPRSDSLRILLLSIAIYSLHGLNIFGLSISNILSIMIVLFLGWKNGMLVGATAGITIGMVLGIIGSSSPVLVASYAISRNDSRNIK